MFVCLLIYLVPCLEYLIWSRYLVTSCGFTCLRLPNDPPSSALGDNFDDFRRLQWMPPWPFWPQSSAARGRGSARSCRAGPRQAVVLLSCDAWSQTGLPPVWKCGWVRKPRRRSEPKDSFHANTKKRFGFNRFKVVQEFVHHRARIAPMGSLLSRSLSNRVFA